MKWAELKQAIEQSGICADDEIVEIRCEPRGGDKTLQPVKLGDFFKLNEPLAEETQRQDSIGMVT